MSNDDPTIPLEDPHLPDPEIPGAQINSHGEFCFVYGDRDIYEHLPIEFPMAPAFGETKPIEWLWPGRVALGMVTFLEGAGGSGKTFVVLDMAARVSRGDPWPGHVPGPERAGDVLLLSGDPDGWERVILPRLMSAGADLMRIGRSHTVGSYDPVVGFSNPKKSTTKRSLNFPHDLPMIEHNIRLRPETRLVVIDSLSAFCADDRVYRAVLKQLEEIAERRNVAIVVTDRPKGRQARRRNPKEGDRRADTVRSVFRVLCDPEDESLYHLAPVRTSFCAEPEWLPFQIGPRSAAEQGKVAWGPPAETPPESAVPVCPARERGWIRRELKEWLLTALLKSDMPVAMMVKEAKAMGFSEMTLRRAREELKVRTFRGEGGPLSMGWWTLRPAKAGPDIPPGGLPDAATLAKIQNWECRQPVTDAESVIVDEILREYEDEDQELQRAPDIRPEANPAGRRTGPKKTSRRNRFNGIPEVLWKRIRGPLVAALLATGPGREPSTDEPFGAAASPVAGDPGPNGDHETNGARSQRASDQEGDNAGKVEEMPDDPVIKRDRSEQEA
jgi:hypothetical protein